MAARKEAMRIKRAAADAAAQSISPDGISVPQPEPPAASGDADPAALRAMEQQLQQALEAQRVAEREATSLKDLMALQAEGIGTMQDELGKLHQQLAAARAENPDRNARLPVTDGQQLRSLRRRTRALAAELGTSKHLMQQVMAETAAGLGTAAAGVARLKLEVARGAQKLASLELASESLREQLTSERVERQKAQAARETAEQRAAAADERVARETQQLRDEAEEAIAERDALEQASKTRNARFAKVQTAHTEKLAALEAALSNAQLAGSQANQKLEQEVGRLTRHVSALEATLQDSEASAAEAAEAAAESLADASAAKVREQEMREFLSAAREEARQATVRAQEAEAHSIRLQARVEKAEAAVAAADEARVSATESAAQEVEAAGGAIEALVAERDAAKANVASLTAQIDSLVGRQGRLVEEMMAQEERLQRLLGDGAVDRHQVANALVAFFQAENAQRKQEILQLLANLLSLDRDQRIEVGLVSRWEHLQPEIAASINAGEAGLSDAFVTFLAAEGR